MNNNARSFSFTTVKLLSLLWICIVGGLVVWRWADFSSLKPNAWGDFFAGCLASPLALFWLVAANFSQGRQLEQNQQMLKHSQEQVELQRTELILQREELKLQRLETARLADESAKHAKSAAESAEMAGRMYQLTLSDLQKRDRVEKQRYAGRFRLRTFQTHQSPHYIEVYNDGAAVSQVIFSCESSLGILQATDRDWMEKGSFHGFHMTGYSLPLEIEVSYVDGRGEDQIDKYLLTNNAFRQIRNEYMSLP